MNAALLLALLIALLLGCVPMAGAQLGRPRWMALARPLALALFACVALAFASLAAAFASNDFALRYVAEHSHRALPLVYRLCAVWGGHEGSMLLWTLMLSAWTAAVALGSRALPLPFVARVLAVMGWLAVGFLLFMLLTSDPFERQFPVPAEGLDLNPLLQDPGMVGHPPLLYLGYVGFSVAFAFAVAALIGGRLDAAWARWTRPWTALAWVFLTLGIALGSWWAYAELGWGGWWFWDPVENASFMPWLAGTALIHSLAVTEKRNAFKAWTVLLAILAFALSLMGTFIVRSGVLSSVHAFASDPQRGLFILCFMGLAVGLPLALYAWRAPQLGLGARFALLSRETLLLANNVMLMAATAAVLLGTLYPLVLDALGLGKISVGPPYFETVFVPLMAPLVFLMGVGPLARWKQATLPELAVRLRWAALVAVIAALASRQDLAATLGLLMAAWIVTSMAVDFWHRRGALPRAVAGMMLAHLGVAVFIAGVTLVRSCESEEHLILGTGMGANAAGHRFVFHGVREVDGPNYRAVQAWVEVLRDGRKLADLLPEKRVYTASGATMTEAAIDSHLTGDLYVALGDPLPGNRWLVRAHIKPFVGWIWGGCLLMAAGGLLAASDRRYRVRKPAPSTALADGLPPYSAHEGLK